MHKRRAQSSGEQFGQNRKVSERSRAELEHHCFAWDSFDSYPARELDKFSR